MLFVPSQKVSELSHAVTANHFPLGGPRAWNYTVVFPEAIPCSVLLSVPGQSLGVGPRAAAKPLDVTVAPKGLSLCPGSPCGHAGRLPAPLYNEDGSKAALLKVSSMEW